MVVTPEIDDGPLESAGISARVLLTQDGNLVRECSGAVVQLANLRSLVAREGIRLKIVPGLWRADGRG